MIERRAAILTAVALIGAGTTTGQSQPQANFTQEPFSQLGDVALGPASSRIDYQSLDPSTGRLYVSMMGAGKLLVFDTRQNKVLAQLDGFPKTTGVLAVPALHRVYASVPGAGLGPSMSVGFGLLGLSAGHGAVAVVDSDATKQIAQLPGGVFPDGIAYDPIDNRVFVSDEMGSAVTVIDAGADRVIARIAAGGEVGNVQYDAETARLYAPIQSKNELAVFDPVKNVRIGGYALPGCDHPHGLAIAPGAAVGFAACDGNDVLTAIDLKTGNILSRLPLGHDPDVLAMDAGYRRLYVASESGRLSRFDIANPRIPVALGESFIGPNAHSVAVDPASHRLYFPLADAGGHAVMRILVPAP